MMEILLFLDFVRYNPPSDLMCSIGQSVSQSLNNLLVVPFKTVTRNCHIKGKSVT